MAEASNSELLRAVDVGAANMALSQGDLERYLTIYAAIGESPNVEKIRSFAKKAFWRGEFDKGIGACEFLGEDPRPEDVKACRAIARKKGNKAMARKADEWLSK